MAAGDYISKRNTWSNWYDVTSPIGRPIAEFQGTPDHANVVAKFEDYRWTEARYAWGLRKHYK